MLRILLTLLACALAVPATAAAKKPTKIFLYHVTAVQATGELTRTYARGHDTVNATARVAIDNRGLRRKGWRGKKNTAFWGTDGWGRLRAPLGDERWTVQGTTASSEATGADGQPIITQGACGGEQTLKGRPIMGAFDRRGGRFELDLELPAGPSEESCGLEESFLVRGTKGTDRLRMRVDPRKMRGKTVTIPFEHKLHRRFDHDEHDGRGVLSTEEMTLTWKGSLTLERGYECTVPPDYPCHTMLL